MKSMIYEIERFCETYAGTSIGEDTKHKLENAEGKEEQIAELYDELEERGYV